MWFLVTQPLLGLDLVSLEPQIPSQAQIHRHACTQAKHTSSLLEACRRMRLRRCYQHQLRALLHPAWPPGCCRQPSFLDRAARLHDLRHLFHDQHLLHRISSTSPWRPSARPEPHRVSLARSQRVLPHPVPDPSGMLLSSAISLRPSWQFQLRVSLRSLPFCGGAAPETSFSQPMLHDVSLVDVLTSVFSNCFRLGHRCR